MKDSGYKKYLLGLLLTILAFNYVDRLALGLVLQDIKLDLKLSDTQLGLLTGIAFTLFYSLMGLPLARWADRGNRVTIISLTTILWSAAVTLCGMVGSFVQLLTVRIAVAVGEAGCIPPAHSLIADYYSRAERPRAVSRYMLGSFLSVLFSYLPAGWLNEYYGWRITFMVLALPGLLLGVLAWFTLREPRFATPSAKRADGVMAAGRRTLPAVAPASTPSPTLRQVRETLWGSATFRHLLLCFAIMQFFGDGLGQWQPAFFIRTYGLETGELGTWFTAIYGIGGLIGTLLGGELASRTAAAHNERLQLRAMAVIYAAFGAISPFIYLAPNHYIAFAIMGFATIIGAAGTGPLFATIQTLVPERMRAIAVATIFMFANLIGTGLGPLVAGALSDALHPILGEQSLRYALLILCPGYIWGGWHLWKGSRTVMQDLAAVHTPHHPESSTEDELTVPAKSAAT
jgi:MFS transporter, Spinster family, sphingosine-1-phosphate transporter